MSSVGWKAASNTEDLNLMSGGSTKSSELCAIFVASSAKFITGVVAPSDPAASPAVAISLSFLLLLKCFHTTHKQSVVRSFPLFFFFVFQVCDVRMMSFLFHQDSTSLRNNMVYHSMVCLYVIYCGNCINVPMRCVVDSFTKGKE